jgi:hypothetical protein
MVFASSAFIATESWYSRDSMLSGWINGWVMNAIDW